LNSFVDILFFVFCGSSIFYVSYFLKEALLGDMLKMLTSRVCKSDSSGSFMSNELSI